MDSEATFPVRDRERVKHEKGGSSGASQAQTIEKTCHHPGFPVTTAFCGLEVDFFFITIHSGLC